MEKILLTIIVFFLEGFVLLSGEVSKALKIFLTICLIVTELLIIVKL